MSDADMEHLEQVRAIHRAIAAHPKEVYDFMCAFTGVFHDDWDFTKLVLDMGEGAEDYIAGGGTFVEPLMGSEYDEHNNWHNRGGLLKAFRALAAATGFQYGDE